MRHPLSLFTIALMTATTVVMGAVILAQIPGAQAQTFSKPEQQALLVYEAIPNFPKENQYRHSRKRKVVEDNTLISRLIRYHVYNKGRSAKYRLDWKITLADYLGINDYMSEREYPGAKFLKTSPMETDLAKIQELTPAERNQLIQAIVDVYDPEVASVQSPMAPTPLKAQPEEQNSIDSTASPSESAGDLLAPGRPTKTKTQPKPSGPAQFLIIDEAP